MSDNIASTKSIHVDLSMTNVSYEKSVVEHYGIEKITNSAIVLGVTNGSISSSVNKLLSNCDELYHKPTLVKKANVEKLGEIFMDKDAINSKVSNLNNSISVKLYDSFDLFSLKHLGTFLNTPSLVNGSYLQEGFLSFIEDGKMVHYLLKDPFSFMNDTSLNLMNAFDKNVILKELDDISTKHGAGYKYYIPFELLRPKIDKGVSEGTCFKLSKHTLSITKGVSADPLFKQLFGDGSDIPNIELEELLRDRLVQNISLGLENEAYLKDRKNILFAMSRSNNKYHNETSENFGILNLLYMNGFDTSRLGSYIQIDAKNWINDSFRNSKVRAVLTCAPIMNVLNQALENPYNHIRTNLDKRLSSVSFNSKMQTGSPRVGDAYDCLHYDLDTCNKIINLHNIYGKFGKQLYLGAGQKLSLDELISEQTGVDAKKLLHEAIQFKKLNPNDTKLNKLYYNSELASEEMKHEMIDLYTNGAKNLEQISFDLSRKYGMNVSSSTISHHARKYYDALESKDFKNRREVREYYHPSEKSQNIAEKVDSQSVVV